jgi:hypothetical protein
MTTEPVMNAVRKRNQGGWGVEAEDVMQKKQP